MRFLLIVEVHESNRELKNINDANCTAPENGSVNLVHKRKKIAESCGQIIIKVEKSRRHFSSSFSCRKFGWQFRVRLIKSCAIVRVAVFFFILIWFFNDDKWESSFFFGLIFFFILEENLVCCLLRKIYGYKTLN